METAVQIEGWQRKTVVQTQRKRIMQQFKTADKTNKHHHARTKQTNNKLYKQTIKVDKI